MHVTRCPNLLSSTEHMGFFLWGTQTLPFGRKVVEDRSYRFIGAEFKLPFTLHLDSRISTMLQLRPSYIGHKISVPAFNAFPSESKVPEARHPCENAVFAPAVEPRTGDNFYALSFPLFWEQIPIGLGGRRPRQFCGSSSVIAIGNNCDQLCTGS